MKFITSVIAGIIVGGLGVYFTLDWQEEKLKFTITAPAKFGEINYQNITIQNTGWNPATNIKIYIEHPGIKFSNVQSASSIKNINLEKNGIASLERIRRDESVVFSLAYEGEPLFGSEVKIASDRSIAVQIEDDNKVGMPVWASSFIAFLILWFVLGILAAIAIPAYKDYKKRALEMAEKVKNS